MLLSNNCWTRFSPFWPWKRPSYIAAVAPRHYLQRGSTWGEKASGWRTHCYPWSLVNLLCFLLKTIAPQIYFLLSLISLSVTMRKHHRSGCMAMNTIHWGMLKFRIAMKLDQSIHKNQHKSKVKIQSKNLNDCPRAHIFK